MGCPSRVGVAGEGDRVSGDLPGVAVAEPGADQDPVGAQPGEEVVEVLRAGGGGAHPAAQDDPGRFPRAHAPHPGARGRAAPRVGSCASRPGWGGRRRYPRPGTSPPARTWPRCGCRPAATTGSRRACWPASRRDGPGWPRRARGRRRGGSRPSAPRPGRRGGQAQAVHELLGDVPPLVVGQVRVDQPAGGLVLRRGQHQVVHRLGRVRHPGRVHRGLEQLGEPRVVPPPGAGDGWLQAGRVAVPGRDHARVDVRGAQVLLPRRSLPVQVGEQPDHAAAAALDDLADHAARRPRRRRGWWASPALISAAVSSSRVMTRPDSAVTRSSQGGGSPVAWNRATA